MSQLAFRYCTHLVFYVLFFLVDGCEFQKWRRTQDGGVMRGRQKSEVSDFRERERLVRGGREVRGRPEPQAFREGWLGRWRLDFVLAFASQKGTLFA